MVLVHPPKQGGIPTHRAATRIRQCFAVCSPLASVPHRSSLCSEGSSDSSASPRCSRRSGRAPARRGRRCAGAAMPKAARHLLRRIPPIPTASAALMWRLPPCWRAISAARRSSCRWRGHPLRSRWSAATSPSACPASKTARRCTSDLRCRYRITNSAKCWRCAQPIRRAFAHWPT